MELFPKKLFRFYFHDNMINFTSVDELHVCWTLYILCIFVCVRILNIPYYSIHAFTLLYINTYDTNNCVMPVHIVVRDGWLKLSGFHQLRGIKPGLATQSFMTSTKQTSGHLMDTGGFWGSYGKFKSKCSWTTRPNSLKKRWCGDLTRHHIAGVFSMLYIMWDVIDCICICT